MSAEGTALTLWKHLSYFAVKRTLCFSLLKLIYRLWARLGRVMLLIIFKGGVDSETTCTKNYKGVFIFCNAKVLRVSTFLRRYMLLCNKLLLNGSNFVM